MKRILQKTRSRIEALRARILLLLHGGQEPSEVATLVGCARATVYRTLYRFEDLGEESLLDQRQRRQPSKVTAEVAERLVGYIDGSPQDFGWQRTTWTLELLAVQLTIDTGVRISPSHVRNVLLANQVHRRRPRVGLRIPVRGRRRILNEIDRLVESADAEDEVTERRDALAAYVTGLLLDGERKSVEPMAARLVDDPAEIQAMRQRLQQAVVVADWADDEMRARLARKLDTELPGVEALVVDDTGFPKKGKHSVAVARQYSGTLGRTDNCQVAVSPHLAGESGSGCIAMRLYLPEAWAEDRRRREAVGVPTDVVFRKKWEIALERIDDALRWGVRKHVVLADAGYGDASEFREALRKRGLRYVVGVQGDRLMWPPGTTLEAPEKRAGEPGRPRTRWTTDTEPVKVAELAKQLGREAYSLVRWREGSRGKQSSRFIAWWITSAEGHGRGPGRPPTDPQWLLCEWPDGEAEPTKFWLAALPKTTSLVALVRLAKLRWRVERDYQELKQEIGLDHYEGRTWRGFHHHATLCAVAHGFLALPRALFPPEEEVDPR